MLGDGSRAAWVSASIRGTRARAARINESAVIRHASGDSAACRKSRRDSSSGVRTTSCRDGRLRFNVSFLTRRGQAPSASPRTYFWSVLVHLPVRSHSGGLTYLRLESLSISLVDRRTAYRRGRLSPETLPLSPSDARPVSRLGSRSPLRGSYPQGRSETPPTGADLRRYRTRSSASPAE